MSSLAPSAEYLKHQINGDVANCENQSCSQSPSTSSSRGSPAAKQTKPDGETPLWMPKNNRANKPIFKFRRFVERVTGKKLDSYNDIHRWSIENTAIFWDCIWKFCEIVHSTSYTRIVSNEHQMFPPPKWFIDARLNYAENLLNKKWPDDKLAIIFNRETKPGETFITQLVTYGQLRERVATLRASLKCIGVKKSDRICGYLPNCIDTIVAMLATASLGAYWSCTSPDFGVSAVVDRFSQIEPKVLFSVEAVVYNGKVHSHMDKLQAVVNSLPSLQKVVVIPYLQETIQESELALIKHGVSMQTLENLSKDADRTLQFEQVPFEHPLFVMFSSGTTGKPKCIVHSQGGTLLRHACELHLQSDLDETDKLLFWTTSGWMMWNWLVSSLFIGCAVVLFDGSPFVQPNILWDMVEDHGVTAMGMGAQAWTTYKNKNIIPRLTHNTATLHTVYSTGSPLPPETFRWMYDGINVDLVVASISGGTDIIGCFVGGTCMLPVYAGECQCPMLGMAVECWNDSGNPVYDECGELVCRRPFPSQPVFFFNDNDNARYRAAYFERFGETVWAHGDYCSISSKTGGVMMLGRSDATLNPLGVRFGSAEIYNVLDAHFGQFIADSVCVGLRHSVELEKVCLFVVMRDNKESSLTDEMKKKISTVIRQQLSPRHVPALIAQVADIPYTVSGKKVEVAVRQTLHGEQVKNLCALRNPDSLKMFENHPEVKLVES